MTATVRRETQNQGNRIPDRKANVQAAWSSDFLVFPPPEEDTRRRGACIFLCSESFRSITSLSSCIRCSWRIFSEGLFKRRFRSRCMSAIVILYSSSRRVHSVQAGIGAATSNIFDYDLCSKKYTDFCILFKELLLEHCCKAIRRVRVSCSALLYSSLTPIFTRHRLCSRWCSHENFSGPAGVVRV